MKKTIVIFSLLLSFFAINSQVKAQCVQPPAQILTTAYDQSQYYVTVTLNPTTGAKSVLIEDPGNTANNAYVTIDSTYGGCSMSAYEVYGSFIIFDIPTQSYKRYSVSLTAQTGFDGTNAEQGMYTIGAYFQ